MKSSHHIAILGGGLLGRLMAWRLSQQGLKIDLYEAGGKNSQASAAFAAAGMLAPITETERSDELIAHMGMAGLAAWPDLLSQLPAPVFMQKKGTLIIWHQQDQFIARRFHQHLQHHAPAELLAKHLRHLTTSELLEIEPTLAINPTSSGKFTEALFLNNEGQLDNRQLLTALDLALTQNNINCHYNTVVEQAPQDTSLTIDCRGMGAQMLWASKQNQLHTDVMKKIPGPLRGVRGEVARVYAPDVTLQRPIRLMHPRYPIYIVPKENHVYVIGATEIDSDDASPVSVRSSLELLSAAMSIHPGFGEARILELNSQVRPTFITPHPAIMLYNNQQKVSYPNIAINGLYRHGFLLAPAVTALATNLVLAILNDQCSHAESFNDWRDQASWPSILYDNRY